MSTAPRGSGIYELYGWYKDGKLLVNRQYQRKLVWTVVEKRKLIDSILSGFPLPLILLAKNKDNNYEIIDGMQRLNAIFSFIETGYFINNKEYFDLEESARARQAQEEGLFQPPKGDYNKLSKKKCEALLSYPLAVTIFDSPSNIQITEVFSRINSSGRQLSNQEKRQAGVVSDFSNLIRTISSDIRGDVSKQLLKFSEMPVISIETKREQHGYGINAEETFWCHHGILSTKNLRESDDEDLIADISASVLLGTPLNRSKEVLDTIYRGNDKKYDRISNELRRHAATHKHQIKNVISLIDNTVRKCDSSPKFLRKTVMGKHSSASSIKTPFYAIFMAFFDLIVKESKFPENNQKILKALKNLNQKLNIQTHHVTTDIRQQNINMVKGLITSGFVSKEPSQLFHGPGLALDFENSLRRSKIEAPHYEFKQGLLQLESNKRKFDAKLIIKLAETACGIANIGPNTIGFIHIGVADRKEHADKIKTLDSIEPVKVDGRWVVGIDREAKLQKKNIEQYVDFFISEFKKVNLSEALKKNILRNIDSIEYRTLSVIRIKIESSNEVSYVNKKCFVREGSHTKPVDGADLEKVFRRFPDKTNN